MRSNHLIRKEVNHLILSRATFCRPGSASWTRSTYNSNCCFKAKSSSDYNQQVQKQITQYIKHWGQKQQYHTKNQNQRLKLKIGWKKLTRSSSFFSSFFLESLDGAVSVRLALFCSGSMVRREFQIKPKSDLKWPEIGRSEIR